MYSTNEGGGGGYRWRIRLMRRVIYLWILVENSCMAMRNWGRVDMLMEQ